MCAVCQRGRVMLRTEPLTYRLCDNGGHKVVYREVTCIVLRVRGSEQERYLTLCEPCFYRLRMVPART